MSKFFAGGGEMITTFNDDPKVLFCASIKVFEMYVYFIVRTRVRIGDTRTGTEQKQETQEITIPPTPQSAISSQTAQLTSPPVRENIPLKPSKCLRARVEHGSQEYKEMEKLLGSSTGQNSLVINQIDKIISDALCEKYRG